MMGKLGGYVGGQLFYSEGAGDSYTPERMVGWLDPCGGMSLAGARTYCIFGSNRG